MQVILFRHGDALATGQEGIRTDEERPLSKKGKKQVRRSAMGLLRIGLSPDRILTSPLVRARETAALIAEVAQKEGNVEICSALAPGSSPQQLLSRLVELKHLECVVCVGHLPDLGFLISEFVLGSPRAELPLKKAGICQLEVLESLDQARLVNFLSPQVLAKLAEEA